MVLKIVCYVDHKNPKHNKIELESGGPVSDVQIKKTLQGLVDTLPDEEVEEEKSTESKAPAEEEKKKTTKKKSSSKN